ncbi:alpha/beta fold hydrolase [Nonomuraea sp. NPDC049400]|uniref:alpha/beta fold hydrolase n=1 Tax=Nonomuraea sp. NPDC049400 TaxID=3364352 RepID=UPI00378CEE0F
MTSEMSANPVATVVLVHGAWHGAWAWERLTPFLRKSGVRYATVELPFTGLMDDIRATRHAIEAVRGPVLLVGHSYGGSVIGAAGDHPDVRGLVFVAAKVVRAGEPQDLEGDRLPPGHVSVLTPELIAAIRTLQDGTTTIAPHRAHEVFYNGQAAEDTVTAIARLRPVSRACATETPDACAWDSLPTTYIVCERDRALPPAVQKAYAARLKGETIRLPTSHSPFWSRPELLGAEIVRRLPR